MLAQKNLKKAVLLFVKTYGDYNLTHQELGVLISPALSISHWLKTNDLLGVPSLTVVIGDGFIIPDKGCWLSFINDFLSTEMSISVVFSKSIDEPLAPKGQCTVNRVDDVLSVESDAIFFLHPEGLSEQAQAQSTAVRELLAKTERPVGVGFWSERDYFEESLLFAKFGIGFELEKAHERRESRFVANPFAMMSQAEEGQGVCLLMGSVATCDAQDEGFYPLQAMAVDYLRDAGGTPAVGPMARLRGITKKADQYKQILGGLILDTQTQAIVVFDPDNETTLSVVGMLPPDFPVPDRYDILGCQRWALSLFLLFGMRFEAIKPVADQYLAHLKAVDAGGYADTLGLWMTLDGHFVAESSVNYQLDKAYSSVGYYQYAHHRKAANESDAIDWMSQGANRGYGSALLDYAVWGQEAGVLTDVTEVFDYVKRSADAGSAMGCFYMGENLSKAGDTDGAIHYLKLATAIGHGESLVMLMSVYKAKKQRGTLTLKEGREMKMLKKRQAG